MRLRFKASKFHKYHHPNPGMNKTKQTLYDGDEITVSVEVANQLLADFPDNFIDVEAEQKKQQADADAEFDKLRESVVVDAPNKMVTEDKPAKQRKKKRGA